MNRIIEIILKTFGLLEAEGRAAKRHAIELIYVAIIWIAATGVAFVGIMGMSAALFIALDLVIPRSLAVAIVSGLLLVLAYFLWMLGKRYHAQRNRA